MTKAQMREAMTQCRRAIVLANARKSQCWGAADSTEFQAACADAEYWTQEIKQLAQQGARRN